MSEYSTLSAQFTPPQIHKTLDISLSRINNNTINYADSL